MVLEELRRKFRNIQRLEEFTQLTDDWNAEDAEAIDPFIIFAVREIIDRVDYQPEIFLGADGSIQLEYNEANDQFIEIQIMDDHYEVFTKDSWGEEAEYSEPLDIDAVVDKMNSFMRFL